MLKCNCVSELPRGVEAVPTHPTYNDRLKRIEQVFKVEGHYWQDNWGSYNGQENDSRDAWARAADIQD